MVPGASGILDFAGLSGNVDFDFYLDSSTHRITEVVVSGNVRAVNIPVKITGAIKYYDYDATDIQLPNPQGTSPTPGATPQARDAERAPGSVA